ncbi:uncharacterized protein V1518DRAFT_415072 [Limtongia smithiae]|uniref:uncharacterized protein n=1 Tax=Limtongia smithiae TaxID=1125753 RepID=UPI0034CDC437
MTSQSETVPAIPEVIVALETTTIADAPVDDDIMADEVEASSDSAVENKRRTFLGNVPYSTTKEEIEALLADFAVETIALRPHKFAASMNSGYAFVDFKTPEDAAKAIEALNGQVLGERTLYLQPAKAKSDKAKHRTSRHPNRPRTPRTSNRRRARPTAEAGSETAELAADATTPAETEAEPESTTEAASEATPAVAPAVNGAGASDENAPPAKSTRPRRRAAAVKKLKEGSPSATTVFVSNLTWSCTSEKLQEFFAELEPESVNVITTKLPRRLQAKYASEGISPRCRGYGFVKFANEEQQKKAIDALNGKELDGRRVFIRIAIDSDVQEKTEIDSEIEAQPVAAESAEAVPAK